MSRSNPTLNAPHPCTRWIEWDGSNGGLRYYDKEEKKNVPIPDNFTFILLDQLGTVKGWHDPSDSGIFANEVRDTKQEVMVVKAFKGGTLAEGIYQKIRDRVAAIGGHFVANCYIAYRDGDQLKIGSLQFKGAALNAWVEFSKKHRADLYKKAIRIKGFDEGKKGKITYRTPKFSIAEITPETDQEATALDKELQEFLKGYFGRTKVEQVDQRNEQELDIDHTPREPEPDPDLDPAGEESEIPF